MTGVHKKWDSSCYLIMNISLILLTYCYILHMESLSNEHESSVILAMSLMYGLNMYETLGHSGSKFSCYILFGEGVIVTFKLAFCLSDVGTKV